MCAINTKPPFSINRNDSIPLVRQVTDGLRDAIICGRYACGSVIPSYRKLAEMLGISTIVTKAALRQIASEGLVAPRPRTGSVVCDRNERRWKGRILLVRRSDGCGYYDNVFESVLNGLLSGDGWLCTPVYVKRTSRVGDADVSALKATLAHPVSLAVVLFDNPAAENLLSSSGVPFVGMGDRMSCRLRGCAGYIHYDRSAAGGPFAAACRAAGVKRVMQVGSEDFDDVRDALRKVGIACRSWVLKSPPPGQPSDIFAELGREAFVRFLKSGKALPDAFYFSDDYICAGALAALADAGIRAPQDVRVATWANRGNVPVYARPLSRIEIDPWKNAETTYAFCRSLLSGERGIKPPALAPTWVVGGTMEGAG